MRVDRGGRIALRFAAALCAVSCVACGLDPGGALPAAPHEGADAGTAPRDAGGTFVNPRPDAGDAGASAHDASPPVDAADAAPETCTNGAPKAQPAAVAFVAANVMSPMFGGGGGFPFDDTCPDGTALVGLNLVGATVSPYSLLQIQAVCAPFTRSACTIDVGPAVALDVHGMTPGTPRPLVCPAGTGVIGLRVANGIFLDSIAIECAPLRESGGTWSRGAPKTVGPAGGTGGAPNPPYECPAPMIANQLIGSAGAFLTEVQIGCATPSAPAP